MLLERLSCKRGEGRRELPRDKQKRRTPSLDPMYLRPRLVACLADARCLRTDSSLGSISLPKARERSDAARWQCDNGPRKGVQAHFLDPLREHERQSGYLLLLLLRQHVPGGPYEFTDFVSKIPHARRIHQRPLEKLGGLRLRV